MGMLAAALLASDQPRPAGAFAPPAPFRGALHRTGGGLRVKAPWAERNDVEEETRVPKPLARNQLSVSEFFNGDQTNGALRQRQESHASGVSRGSFAPAPEGQAEESASQDVASTVALGVVVTLAAVAAAVLSSGGVDGIALPSPGEVASSVGAFFADPTGTLEAVVAKVESMGPLGYVYFGAVYVVAEVLAIPAIPLTASAGYLFGVVQGTGVVLAAASIAAAVSFVIGRTLLRSYVEGVLEGFPKFQKVDKAIGRDGFKLMVLLRIAPVFPFALSNYLYGATSVPFWDFLWGTLVGFTPGTIAYVYTGEIGKALTGDAASASPWYIYAGGLALLTGFLKVAADVAAGIIDDLEDEQ